MQSADGLHGGGSYSPIISESKQDVLHHKDTTVSYIRATLTLSAALVDVTPAHSCNYGSFPSTDKLNNLPTVQ